MLIRNCSIPHMLHSIISGILSPMAYRRGPVSSAVDICPVLVNFRRSLLQDAFTSCGQALSDVEELSKVSD